MLTPAGVRCGRGGRGYVGLLEFGLVQVPPATGQPFAYLPLHLAERGPIGVVVVLHDLEGPSVSEHVAADEFPGDPIGDLVVPGLTERVDRVADLEVSLAGQLVEVYRWPRARSVRSALR